MKQSHIDVAVVFYKGNRRMTKAELDEINVKLKQTNY